MFHVKLLRAYTRVARPEMFHVKHSTTTTSCTRKQNQHKTSKTMGFAAFRKRKILALPTAYLCASAVQCFAQCKNTRSSLSAARFIGICRKRLFAVKPALYIIM